MTGSPIIVARVARAHGIRGGLLLDIETDVPEALFQTGRRLRVVEGGPGTPSSLRVSTARPHQRRWLVTVEGVTDRSAAERLRGARLAVPREELPEMEEGEFLLHDLIGLAIVEGDRELGRVEDVYELPAGPMLAFRLGGRERLIPLDDNLVLGIDFETETIRVELPEGLLDL